MLTTRRRLASIKARLAARSWRSMRTLGQGDHLNCREQRCVADLRQVTAQGIARAVAHRQIKGGDHLVAVTGDLSGEGCGSRVFDDLDAEVGEHREQIIGLICAKGGLAYDGRDLGHAQIFLLAATRNQVDDLIAECLGRSARLCPVALSTHGLANTHL